MSEAKEKPEVEENKAGDESSSSDEHEHVHD